MTRSFAHLPLLPALALAGLGACSSSSSDSARACTVQMSGNVTAMVSPSGGCSATLEAAVDGGSPGDRMLVLNATTPSLANLDVTIDLGNAPSPGTLSSDNVTAWNASAISGDASSECVLSAGGDAVPAGSFSLTLTSVDVGGGTAHGTLSLLLYMHAPPSTDCGAGDIEAVAISF